MNVSAAYSQVSGVNYTQTVSFDNELKDVLSIVDTKLSEIRQLSKNNSIEQLSIDKAQKKNLLDDCYFTLVEQIATCTEPSRPSKEIVLRLADVIRQSGQLCYADGNQPKQFEVAKQMLLPSLSLFRYATGVEDSINGIDFSRKELASRDEYEEYVQKNLKDEPFQPIANAFDTIDCAYLLEKASDAKLSADDQFCYAFTLRYLNGAYRTSHENNQVKTVEEEDVRIRRHEKFIFLAEGILKLDPPSARKAQELYDLNYNDKPGYFRLIDNDAGYDQNYAELLVLAGPDRCKQYAIWNKRACGEKERGTETQLNYFNQSWKLRELAKDELDPSLYMLSLRTEAIVRFGWKPDSDWTVEDAKEAEALIEKAKAYAEQLIKYGINHNYFRENEQVFNEILKTAAKVKAKMEEANTPQANPADLFQIITKEMKLAEQQMQSQNYTGASTTISSFICNLVTLKLMFPESSTERNHFEQMSSVANTSLQRIQSRQSSSPIQKTDGEEKEAEKG